MKDRKLKIFSGAGFVIMTAAILYGFMNGSFLAQGGELISMAWGVVTLIDLYLMLAIFCSWILHREGFGVYFVIWSLLIIVTGSLGAAGYILKAAVVSEDRYEFWHGNDR